MSEAALKHYAKAAETLMDLMRNEGDPQRKEVFKKHLQECLASSEFLKVTVRD